jgi:hypothetical protein
MDRPAAALRPVAAPIAAAAVPVALAAAPTSTVYASSQTVHQSSINDAFLKGARILETSVREPMPIEDAMDLAFPSWRHRDIATHVHELCENNHLIGGFRFKVLFCCAMARIRDSPHKDLLLTRLREEMNDGRGYCLQGNMCRLVNTFSNIEAGIVVGVSSSEQLQAAMSAIQNNRALRTGAAKRKAALASLEELQVPEDQRAVWLDAFDDETDPPPLVQNERQVQPKKVSRMRRWIQRVRSWMLRA